MYDRQTALVTGVSGKNLIIPFMNQSAIQHTGITHECMAGWGAGPGGVIIIRRAPSAKACGTSHRGTSLLLRFGSSSGLRPFSGSLVIRPFSGSPRARAPARSTTAEVKKVHYGPTGSYVGRRASCTDHRPPPRTHATLLKGARGREAGTGLGFW